MDMQGKPVGATSEGTKVTSDPERYQNPVSEGPGPIAADSLAAESTRHGGVFSANENSEPLGVKGGASTFNNTNISGATTLPPAPDADARQSQSEWEESSRLKGAGGIKYAECVGGQGDYPGVHSDQGYVGAPSDESTKAREDGTGTYQTSSAGGRPVNADPAPTYVNPVVNHAQGGAKGKNIQEGGFDSNAPNASFTAEIGSKNDPGRVAEGYYQRETAESGLDAGSGARQQGVDGGQPYGILKSDETA